MAPSSRSIETPSRARRWRSSRRSSSKADDVRRGARHILHHAPRHVQWREDDVPHRPGQCTHADDDGARSAQGRAADLVEETRRAQHLLHVVPHPAWRRRGAKPHRRFWSLLGPTATRPVFPLTIGVAFRPGESRTVHWIWFFSHLLGFPREGHAAKPKGRAGDCLRFGCPCGHGQQHQQEPGNVEQGA